ncbi:MAG: hypothetical protein N3E38_03110, partial [Candidatus Aenigmarchaeota archaeon]|nr:hypothetical protein [Candidatus Aenigmarchaeota archaeon]
FDMNNTNNGYRLTWLYQIGRGGWILELRKIINGIEYPLASTTPNSIRPNIKQWYKFELIRNYPNIKFLLNNTLIFNVNDTQFKRGHIGFSRYTGSSIPWMKSWYDDPTIMLYVEPWPDIYLGPEEEIKPINISFDVPPTLNIKLPQKIYTTVYLGNQPITNLTSNDLNITIPQASVEKLNFQNYNNGTYSIEVKINTKYLGKKQLTLTTPYAIVDKHSYILTTPEENSIIITNNYWKNFITAASTNKTVLITNSTELIELYNPKELFLLDTNFTTNKPHYYIDRETLALVFFREKEIVTTTEIDLAITSSSLQLPIVFDINETLLELLKPKHVYDILTQTQLENLYKSKNLKTNYIILANKDSEKSIVASSLAFKNNGFVILSSGNANQTKQKLKEKMEIANYRKTNDYKFKDKIFLALVDVPYFLIDDPVDDGLIDYDGKKIKTDTPYADINDDGYLDFSSSRLEGSFEALTHQIYFPSTQNKKALIVSVYETQFLDLFYGAPLMQYSQALRGRLMAYGFNVSSLVEKRSSKDEYSQAEIKQLFKDVNSFFKENNFDNLISQVRLIFSTFNEAVYVLLEFDWPQSIESMLKDKNFVLKHLPIYTQQNLLSSLSDKDLIIYMAKGNKTHFYLPDSSSIKISQLPKTPSFFYLYYTNSYEALEDLQKNFALSLLLSTANSYTPQSAYSSYLLLRSFNGEISYVIRNGKNTLFKHYAAMKNVSFRDTKPYLKDYYSKTLYSEPAKVFDPFIEQKQSDDVVFNGNHLVLNISLNPKYYIAFNNGKKVAHFDTDEYIDGIPIYRKSVILPQDTEIINVNFSFSEIQENLEPINISSNFWFDVYKLEDNRSVLEIIVFPITNRGGVLKDVSMQIYYNAKLEITNIKAENSILKFTVYSYNYDEANANILVETEKENFYINQFLHLKPGLNNYTISLPQKGFGLYSVTLIIENSHIVGPKYTYFYLNPITAQIKNFPRKISTFFDIEKILLKKTFSEKTKIHQAGDKQIIEYISPHKKLYVEITSNEIEGQLIVNGKKLLIKENFNEKNYTFISSELFASIYSSKGLMKQTYSSPEALEELKNLIMIYNELMLKIKEQNS